jgi:hypothetical protein
VSPQPSSDPPGAAHAERLRPLADVLRALASDARREHVSVRDLLHALGGRAIGALMFIFAVPNVLPVPPGTSALLGAPLVFLAAQLALGRPPWLPGLVARRSLPRREFAALVQRVAPWLVRAESLLRPRWAALSHPPLRNAVGLVCLGLSLVLVLPVPLGNVLPALAISVLALGVLAHDGLWIAAGLALAALAVAVVSGVLWAALKLLAVLAGA